MAKGKCKEILARASDGPHLAPLLLDFAVFLQLQQKKLRLLSMPSSSFCPKFSY